MGVFGPVQTVTDEKTLQIFLVGNIVDAEIADQIWAAFEDNRKVHVLISFKQVSRIDSMALSMIVKIFKQVGKGLVLCEITPPIMRMLSSLKFDSFMEIKGSIDEARAYLKGLSADLRVEIEAGPENKPPVEQGSACDNPVVSEQDFLFRALESEEPVIRAHAAETLGKLGVKEAVARLIDLLGDKDAAVSMAAVESLGKIGDPAAIPHLLKCAECGEEWLQSACAHALGLLKAREALELLQKLSHSDNRLLARNSRWALGQIQDHQ